MAIKILRVEDTVRTRGRCRTTLYDDIKAGLWPEGVRLGKRAVGWPEHEADQLNAARIAGLADDEIRRLVKSLVAARSFAVARTGA